MKSSASELGLIRQNLHTAPSVNYVYILVIFGRGFKYDSGACIINVLGCAKIFPLLELQAFTHSLVLILGSMDSPVVPEHLPPTNVAQVRLKDSAKGHI